MHIEPSGLYGNSILLVLSETLYMLLVMNWINTVIARKSYPCSQLQIYIDYIWFCIYHWSINWIC